MTFHVMVLNDDETYTVLQGCKILEIEDEWFEHPSLDEVVKEVANGTLDTRLRDCSIVTEFS